jgi:hypothetical protein
MILSWLLICAPFFTSIYYSFITFQPLYLGFFWATFFIFIINFSISLLPYHLAGTLFFARIIWLDLYFLPESSGWVFIFALILRLDFNPRAKIQKIDEISVLTINQFINCQDQMLKN